MIDLHTHTTASDGTDSPAELVRHAAAAGVTTLAITDHDTTGGWGEAVTAVQALATAGGPRLSLLRGTEFSCVYRGQDGRPISLHLLGYLYDPLSSELKAERLRLRQNRLGRGEQIVRNLADAGYPITWEQVSGISGDGAVGRPHIGRALVQAGVVGSVNDAFADLLSSRSPYYVAKQDMDVHQAIPLIRAAGGVTVIAHPWARRRGPILPEAALLDLVETGLQGIEVDHTDHTPQDRARLREIATDLDLVVTGSSDYHGTNKTVRLAAETTQAAQLDRLTGLATGSEPIEPTGR